jgi:hypothetical protein
VEVGGEEPLGILANGGGGGFDAGLGKLADGAVVSFFKTAEVEVRGQDL